MASYFFDSSALVKRYVREVGSDWIRSLMARRAGHDIYLALITEAEMMSALARRNPPLSPLRLARAQAILQLQFQRRFQVVPINEVLVAQAMTLAVRYRLRGYDAVQLAAALEARRLNTARGLPALILVSADVDLNAAAAAEGFTVDDPRFHP